jgi:hypothetical protein
VSVKQGRQAGSTASRDNPSLLSACHRAREEGSRDKASQPVRPTGARAGVCRLLLEGRLRGGRRERAVGAAVLFAETKPNQTRARARDASCALLKLVKRESSANNAFRLALLEYPSLVLLADGGSCTTQDIGLLQLVRRDRLDLERGSIPIIRGSGPGTHDPGRDETVREVEGASCGEATIEEKPEGVLRALPRRVPVQDLLTRSW